MLCVVNRRVAHALPFEPPLVESNTMTLAPVIQNKYGGLHSSQKDASALGIEIVPEDAPVTWQLKMTRPGGSDLQENEIEALILVLGYGCEKKHLIA